MSEAVIKQAYTVTVDIHQFSKQTDDVQWRWYSALKRVMGEVLDKMRVAIATEIQGAVFWSSGGDGGTLTVFEGGATRALLFAVTTAERLAAEMDPRDGKAARDGKDRFDIRIGIDKGLVHIALDLNGSPNVWGTAINNSHRIAAACIPGQLLASEGFVTDLLYHTSDLREYIDNKYLNTRQPQKVLAKHNQFFSVVNVYNSDRKVGRPASDASTVADFERPFTQMADSYRGYLNEMVRVGSARWSLLLARKLHDLGRITDTELFDNYIFPASYGGQSYRSNNLRDPFFSCFDGHDLSKVICDGRFIHRPRGAVLCRLGDVGEEMYVIAQGRLLISEVAGDDPVARGPGDIVGEMALIQPGYLKFWAKDPKRTAQMTAAADGDVTLFAIPYQSIRDVGSPDTVLRALVQSYSERKKETALRTAGCFRKLGDQERLDLRNRGDLVGRAPGDEQWPKPESWKDDCMHDCLIVCCHGRITVTRGSHSFVASSDAGRTMQSVWLPARPGAAGRFEVTAAAESEFLVWRHEKWGDWLKAESSRGALISTACDGTLG
jgi:hypothetical protein